MPRCFCIVCIMLFVCIPISAKDRDGDGISDVVEQQLGTPVDEGLQMLTVASSPNRGTNKLEAGKHCARHTRLFSCSCR